MDSFFFKARSCYLAQIGTTLSWCLSSQPLDSHVCNHEHSALSFLVYNMASDEERARIASFLMDPYPPLLLTLESHNLLFTTKKPDFGTVTLQQVFDKLSEVQEVSERPSKRAVASSLAHEEFTVTISQVNIASEKNSE